MCSSTGFVDYHCAYIHVGVNDVHHGLIGMLKHRHVVDTKACLNNNNDMKTVVEDPFIVSFQP